MENLVSVIIPCYNSSNSLPITLQSVEQQSYKNIEIICVNDGSTDNTMTLLQEYREHSHRLVHIINQKNTGVSGARNKGIQTATGEFIVFLDADDAYAPTTIENLVEGIKAGNVDTAFGFWTRELSELEDRVSECEHLTQKQMMDFYMFQKKTVGFYTFIYKSELIKKNQLFFAEDIRYGEDTLFFWQYLVHVKSGNNLNIPLYWYHDNPQSAVHQSSWEKVTAVTALERIVSYMKEKNFPYYNEFKNYLPARTEFMVAKEFARYQDKENFYKFINTYHTPMKMSNLFHKNGWLLTVSAFVLKFNPMLFYFITSTLYDIKRKLK